jgi:hypothetical protein
MGNMGKLILFSLILIFALLPANSFAQNEDTLEVWVERIVTPSEIFYEGAGGGDTATVIIRAYASEDTLKSGTPVDVIFVLDRSPSMNSIDPPGTITRIEGARIAMINFVDTYLANSGPETRAAFFYLGNNGPASLDYCTAYDFNNTTNDPGFSNLKTAINNNTTTLTSGTSCGESSQIWDGIMDITDLVLANRRPGIMPVVIYLTDAYDFSDEYGGSGGFNTVLNRVTNLNADSITQKIYTVTVGAGDTTRLRQIAEAGDGISAFSQTGSDLDSVFKDIGQTIFTAAAIQIDAVNSPMFIDVLGPNIHYVPNSFYVHTDSAGFIPPGRISLAVDTVTSGTQTYVRLKFDIDTINVNEVLKIEYQVTAALYEFPPTGNKIMRLNNYQADDPSYYSRFKYRTYLGTEREKLIDKRMITVKTRMEGIFISTSPTSYVPPDPSGAKTIQLDYSLSQPGSFGPTNLFAVLQVSATDTVKVGAQGSWWQFVPNPAWTSTPANMTYTNIPSSSKLFGVTVPNQNIPSDADTLFVKYLDPFTQILYFDSLIFNATYHQINDSLVSIYITDNAGSQTGLGDYTLRGNYAQLDNYSIVLYAMGATILGNFNAVSATWTSSGFSSLEVGTGSSNTLKLDNLPPRLNSPRNSVDTILITYTDPVSSTMLTDLLIITILDTTDYDTVDAVVITPYSNYINTSNKHTLYDIFNDSSSYSPYSGDTVTFVPLLFDVNTGGNEKFLGNSSTAFDGSAGVTWYLNGTVASTDSIYSFMKIAPGSVDEIVAVYNNGIANDTIQIHWQYGHQRILHIEGSPGVVGQAGGSDLTMVTFTTAVSNDTVYAVIRDELGYCVSNTAAIQWSFTDPIAAAPYLQKPPSDSITNMCYINKLQNPADSMSFILKSILSAQEIQGIYASAQEKTVTIKLANYSYDAVGIFADSSNNYEIVSKMTGIFNTSGKQYQRDELILSTDTIRLVAIDDEIVLKARLHRDDVDFWEEGNVSWDLSDYTWLDESGFPDNVTITLRPKRSATGVVTLTATYTGGISAIIYLVVEPAYIHSFEVIKPGEKSAGEVAPVYWRAVDAEGNTVTDPSRQPDSVKIFADKPVKLVLGPGDTIEITGEYVLRNPFVSGEMTNDFYSTVAGTIGVNMIAYYGDQYHVEQVDLVFTPGAPSIVQIVHKSDGSDALVDTLSPFGTTAETQESYIALLYDRFGNLITDPSITGNIKWSSSHGNLTPVGNEATYDARGSGGNYHDTVRAVYTEDIAIQDNFVVFVIPIVGVVEVSTHEYLGDTLGNVSDVEYVLGTIFGVDVNALKQLAPGEGVSENYKLVESLRLHGYDVWRDGYLDYLDIVLSDSIYLSSSSVSGVHFDTVNNDGKPDTVIWPLSNSLGNSVQLLPLDNSGRRYRLWLLSHSYDVDAPLETGFLPLITFNNNVIYAQNDSLLRLGGAGAFYTVHPSVVKDSAPPVIHRFIHQNNKCDTDDPVNRIKIGFSEPVLFSGISSKSVESLCLVNGSNLDSTFMLTAIGKGYETNEVYDALLAWNFGVNDLLTMTYTGEILEAAEKQFRPGFTKLRFSVLSSNVEFLDVWGHSGTVSLNRPVTLENDLNINPICKLEGNTLVDRYAAMHFSWSPSPDPEDNNALVPDYPFFGFEINLNVMATSGGTSEMEYQRELRCGSEVYAVVDYASDKVFVSTEVQIFDLLGNLVATPAQNKSLKIEYTAEDIKKFLKMEDIDCNKLNDYVKNNKYFVVDGEGSDPDTLVPIYGSTITIGYEVMKEAHDNQEQGQVVPAWNCVNIKGRLVAPGGYIARQTITAQGDVEEVIKKFIVTSRERKTVF